MKRRDVIRKIGKAAGQGGVPRHTEIDDGLAEKMFRECEEVLGRGWWR